jgi:hypothetical protein
MPRKKLILIASDRMDGNKKEDRDENRLVRMSAATRNYMDFTGKVELSSSAGKKAMLLDIFHAFSADVKEIKRRIDEGELTAEEAKRVGFVTTRTYNAVTGGNKDVDNIWISETIEENVLGTDPEFLLFAVDKEEVIRANDVLPKEGVLGCDGAMAEIRPNPAISTEDLIKNINRIFSNKKITDRIKDYRWMSMCYHKDKIRDYPVGGHIHVGNTVQVANLPASQRKLFFNTINKIMDELLAIPMMKFDGAENGSCRRIKCNMGLAHGNHRGYGYFGEWRACRVGGEEHFEHRTLSGMWLIHPSVAKAVLGTAKVIVDEIFKMSSVKGYDSKYVFPNKYKETSIWSPKFEDWGSIPLAKDMGCTRTSGEMIQLLNSSSPDFITKKYLDEWHTHLKSMSSYKKNSNYVDALYEILKISSNQLAGWDRQIQKNWLGNKKFLVEI